MGQKFTWVVSEGRGERKGSEYYGYRYERYEDVSYFGTLLGFVDSSDSIKAMMLEERSGTIIAVYYEELHTLD